MTPYKEHRPQIGRRDFIRITAIAASAVGLQACTWNGGCRNTALKPVRDQRIIMGTIADLTVVDRDEASARRAIDACYSKMHELEAVLSRFQPKSELSRLNKEGLLEHADPALISVVQRAIEYGRLTNGSFDITVEPVLVRYREAARAGTIPAAGEINSLLGLVDYRRLDVAEETVHLGLEGMAITLDGIAKGFIIDQGAEVLRLRGFEQVLVEVGGDLVAGAHPDRAWQIGIQSPRPTSNAWLGVAQVVERAMATSGDYMNTFSKDYGLHHIIDPRRGISPSTLASASVLAPTAMDADALSTALMVLGPVDGLELARGMPEVEALLVGKDLSEYSTRGFPMSADTSPAKRQ